jgi:hypothetical protein
VPNNQQTKQTKRNKKEKKKKKKRARHRLWRRGTEEVGHKRGKKAEEKIVKHRTKVRKH